MESIIGRFASQTVEHLVVGTLVVGIALFASFGSVCADPRPNIGKGQWGFYVDGTQSRAFPYAEIGVFTSDGKGSYRER
jgi:hypothetical protein